MGFMNAIDANNEDDINCCGLDKVSQFTTLNWRHQNGTQALCSFLCVKLQLPQIDDGLFYHALN